MSNPLLTGDHYPIIFDNLNSLELLTLFKTNKQMQKQIANYVFTFLSPYAYVYYSMSPYCISSVDYNKNIKIPDLEYAKRALALAVTFQNTGFEVILKLYPVLISSVIETRTVKITHPKTKECFSAQWHFKLSHLLAAENNFDGKSVIWHLMEEKYKKEFHKEFSKFFSESISWEAGDKKGNKGPTGPFIALLYQHGKFFCEIAKEDCVLTLKDEEFDVPYNKINPCYLALEVQKKSKHEHCFYVLINLYSHTPSSSVIAECIKDIFSEAVNGDNASLHILLDSPSPYLSSYLHPELFKAIEANNMDIIKLISIHLKNVNYVRNVHHQNPLYVAVEKTLKDKRYLPMVKFFICCGYAVKEFGLSTIDLIKEDLVDSFIDPFTSIFHVKDNVSKKTIRHYFEVAECFTDLVSFCLQNDNKSLFWNTKKSEKQKDPVKILFTTAKMDKEFFNELVASFLQNGDEWMLNKALNQLDDRKRFFNCLYQFMRFYEKSSYFTASTLEKIGDSLRSYNKSITLYEDNDEEVPQLALYFYEQALKQADISIESRLRIENNLRTFQQAYGCFNCFS